jgi:ubiquinone/menaquinone biosynthesis C-methylase UbiE
MMAIAQSKLQPSKEVIFQTADGTALLFPDASFDTVVCQFGMMFYPDRDKGYREAYRVLGPRGRYLFSVWDSHGYNAFGRITHEVVEHFFPTDTPTFYKVPFGYQSIDLIKDQLIAAGSRPPLRWQEKEFGHPAKMQLQAIIFEAKKK